MHPLLAQRRSLSAYLLFWAGLSAVPWVLIHSTAPLGALVLSAACTVAFALGTLVVWYLCRALPLLPAKLWRVVSIHAATAALWSVGFVACAQLLAELLALLPAWHGLPADVGAAEGALFGVGALFYLLVATFHYVLAELEQRRMAGEREAVLALAAQRAELSALRAQVHPHFLFNSLNTVSALIGYDPVKARDACLLLAQYLRGTLGAQERALVPLREEWALCERYLAVEALRLGERLRIEVSMEESAQDCEIPSLLLQPLVENAVTHGIAPVDEPQPLRVRARCHGGRLTMELDNGLDPAPHARQRLARHEGGVGLANVRARLFGQYGNDAALRVEREVDRFSVVLDLPASSPHAAEER
ncbi:MAG TPA: histidine kinase [Polyangiaceae bacterium]|nr:histidine kinase [Polyangiaceae bacterium]